MKKLLLVLGFFVDFMIVGKKVQLTDVVGFTCYKYYINYSKMKRTLLPITLVTLLSIFIYSCSSGDDDSAPPSVIQTPTPEPDATQYTLTVSAGEGGSVTNGGTFDEGTKVEIKASALEGYVFNGWNDGSNLNPRNFTLAENTNATASFISLNDYFNQLYRNSSTFNESNVNQTTGNYNSWFRPFTDFNSLIERKIFEFVIVKENGHVSVNSSGPGEENHGHEQGWFSFLNINNNDIPDMVIVGTVISSENYGEAYVIIDNELKYRFDTGQAGTRKILIGDIDNNGSDDAVLVATGIDTQPYSGSPTQIIYFTPNSYEFVNLDDDPSFYHTGGIGDLNNDGNLDLIIVNNQGPEDTFVFIGDGNKNFSKIPIGNMDFFANRTTVSLYDLNNDGDLDLIAGGWEKPSIGSDGEVIERRGYKNEIFYGNGDGTFDMINTIELPEIEYWAKVNHFIFHDIDNDGQVEIIINRTTGHESFSSVENDSSYDGVKIQILKKEGDGYVNHQIINQPEGWYDFPPTWIEWIPWIRLFDVNGDNIMDIVPDSENINDPNYNPLKRYWGMYYRGSLGGTFEIDYFDRDQINN